MGWYLGQEMIRTTKQYAQQKEKCPKLRACATWISPFILFLKSGCVIGYVFRHAWNFAGENFLSFLIHGVDDLVVSMWQLLPSYSFISAFVADSWCIHYVLVVHVWMMPTIDILWPIRLHLFQPSFPFQLGHSWPLELWCLTFLILSSTYLIWIYIM